MLALLLSTAFAADSSSTADACRKFLAERLEVAPLRISTVEAYSGRELSSVDLWTVYRGKNTIIRAREFAELVGDSEMADKMRSTRTIGEGVGIPMVVVGGGLALFGLYKSLDFDHSDTLGATAATLGGGGLITGGLLLWVRPVKKEKWVKNYYSEEDATGLVDEHNQHLLDELGITKDDVAAYLRDRADATPFSIQPVFAGTAVGFVGTF